MLRGLQNAFSALRAQQQKTDVISHNMANINTTGYKKKEALFSDVLYQTVERPGNAVAPADGPDQKQIVNGGGTIVSAIRHDLRSGSYIQTMRPHDFAIDGDGFFCVTLPDGREAYTRDGSFQPDSEGNIVSSHGYRLNFPVLPQEDCLLQVNEEGFMTAIMPSGEIQDIGQIEIAYFDNPQGLENAGRNLFTATDASGEAIVAAPHGRTSIRQGWLESSNVELTEEMVHLIRSQRSFQLNARALSTIDEMMGIANQLRR